MFCKNCGNKLLEGDMFCCNCGTPVAEVQEKATEPVQEVATEATAEEVKAVVAEATAEEVKEVATEATAEEVKEVATEVTAEEVKEVAEATTEPVKEEATDEPKEFCTNCGEVIGKGMKFCMKCGTPVAAEPVKKTPNKKVRIGIVAAVAVLAIIFLFSRGGKGGFKTPEEAFEACMNGYTFHDFDWMLQSYPEFRIEYCGGEEQIKSDMEVVYQDQLSQYATEGVVIEYKATGHTPVEEGQLMQVEQDINSTFGVDEDLEEAAYVTYEVHVTPANGNEQIQSATGAYATKYDGRWYYFNVQ